MTDRLHATLLEASSPDTSPERLRDLYAWDGPPQLWDALARNPNTPGDLFFWLFPKCPNEVAANPALARALLENPKLLHFVSRETRHKLALDPALKEAALRLLIGGETPYLVLRLLSLRPDLAEPFLMMLAENGVDVAQLLHAPNAGVAFWQKAAQVRHEHLVDRNQIYLSRERRLPESARRILEQQGDAEVLQSLQWRAEPPIAQKIPILDYAGATEGRPKGELNEDRFATFQRETLGLFLVADGSSGGIRTGHIAAEKTCETLLSEIANVNGPLRAQDFFHDAFYKAFHAIARSVSGAYDYTNQFPGRWLDTNGASATVAALLLQGSSATIAHLGDCRIYLLRNGRLQRLTQDHDLRWLYQKLGRELPPEPFLHGGALARYLGDSLAGSSPALTRLQVSPGDRLLLCSDGVYECLAEERLRAILQTHTPRDAADQIVREWRSAGGADDMVALVVHVL